MALHVRQFGGMEWQGGGGGRDTLIDNKMPAETEVFSFLYHEMEQLRSTFASETILKEHNDGKYNHRYR